MTSLVDLARDVADLEAALRVARPCVVLDRVPFCPHTPTPPQRMFLELDTGEAFYGGAAGGGKSDALLMAALQFVDRPGYAALLLRRTFPDLRQPGALMPRLAEWLAGSGATWREMDRTWSFPSGATITFGYAESLADIQRAYQGAEYQFIGIDELGQWREVEYLYLLSRLRRSVASSVPLRVRAAGNPGGIGHAWVKARFVSPGHTSRPFVAARAVDNPHLDVASYLAQLDLLDSETRAHLRDGDWDANASGRVYHAFDRSRHIVASLPPGVAHYVLAMDLGTSEEKPTGGRALWAWVRGHRVAYCVRSWSTRGGSPQRDAEEIATVREHFPHARIVVDAGALGAGYLRDFQKRFGNAVKAAEKRDKAGARRLFNGELERDRIALVAGEHRGERDSHGVVWDYPTELEQLRYGPDGLDADPSQPDHLSDAGLYGWRECYAWAETQAPDPPTPDEAVRREHQRMEQARIAQMLRSEAEDEW